MVKLSDYFGKRDKKKQEHHTTPPTEPDKGLRITREAFPQGARTEKISDASTGKPPHSRRQEQAFYGDLLADLIGVFQALSHHPEYIDPKILIIADRIAAGVVDQHVNLMSMVEMTTLDNILFSHSINTAIIAVKLAQGLACPPIALKDIAVIALLHHTGLFAITELSENRLTVSDKQARMIIDREGSVKKIVHNIICLHENLFRFIFRLQSQDILPSKQADKTKKLSEKQINDYVYLIKLASLYEVLTHSKPDQKRIIPHIVCKWLLENWQILNDNAPAAVQCIKSFIENIGLFPVGSYITLSTEEIARIIHIEKASPVRPFVEIILTSKLQRPANIKRIALKNMPLIYIKEAVDETLIKAPDKKLQLSLRVRRWWTNAPDR